MPVQYFEVGLVSKVNIGRREGGVIDHSNIYAYIHQKMNIMQTKFFFKCQIKITKNLKSGLNCPVYIFGPVDIMVIDKTDSLEINVYGQFNSCEDHLQN